MPRAANFYDWARAVLLGGALLTAAGCTTVSFYTQAIAGQVEIWRQQIPLEQALASADVDPSVRKKLRTVIAARDFAYGQLQLPDKGSYRKFVQLERDYVVWNVFAAPPLSLEPQQSCFLLVGCLAYRGYFTREDAERYAAGLRAQGFDVYLGGVAAYSTLGWFDDPILSTFLRWNEDRIVEVLFHELAHQQLYVTDDTTFNESFAVAVASAGAQRWRATRGQDEVAAAAAAARESGFIELLMATRQKLAEVYAGNLDDEAKHRRKAELFAELIRDYAELKQAWGGVEDYDSFMQQPWNNAKLSSIVTYNDLVPAFAALFGQFGGDFTAAYAAAATIAALKPADRVQCLQSFLGTRPGDKCPPEITVEAKPP